MVLVHQVLQLLLLAGSIHISLRLVYGLTVPADDDLVYYVLRLMVRLLLLYAIFSALVAVAGIGGMILWFVVLFVTAVLLTNQAARRRQTLLSMLTVSVEGGIPLSPTLRALAQEESGRWRRQINKLADGLEQGQSLPDAMRRSPNALPTLALAYAEVGSQLNALPEALKSAAATERSGSQFWAAVTSQLSSVLVVLGVFLFAFLFCVLKVAPAYQRISRF